MRILLILMCLCSMSVLNAIHPNNAKESTSSLRILELLPNLPSPLGVEPAVPENFVAMGFEGTMDLYNCVYWGPKDALKNYFKNPSSLNVPVLKIWLSTHVAQTGPDSFSDTFDQLKKMYPKGFSERKSRWGNYPVHSVKTMIENKWVYLAWVGLNDPESGWTLVFNLVYPEKKGHPDQQDQDLWENFLAETRLLSEPDYFKAAGQDLQPGYTIVNIAGMKLKMTAEKRERDGMLQVVVVPITSNIEFQFSAMDTGLLGSQWNLGKPLVKVYGTTIKKDGNSTVNLSHTTSILIENVPEFSVSKEEKKFIIYQKSPPIVPPEFHYLL